MEKNENVLTVLGSEFTKELTLIVQQVLAKNGVRKSSDLADSVEWQYSREGLLMYVNDYYKSVSEGRKPKEKKIPIYSLIQWIKKYNITSTKYPSGQLAYIIQRSIYLNGIKGKHFLEQVQESVTDSVEIKLADGLEELIADSLYTALKVK
jgi:hypothetical protein